MVISWYGEGCFRIQNGEVVLLSDPPDGRSGITAPRFKTDILLKSITAWPFDPLEKTQGDTTVFGPGEHDIKGVHIKGFGLPEESSSKYFKSVYYITWEEISLGFLGHLSSASLPPPALSELEEVDVLFAPAGGDPFISVPEMGKLMKIINPKILIPSFYKIPGLERKAGGVEELSKQFNGEVSDPREKWVFKKKDLIDIKKTQIMRLAPQR